MEIALTIAILICCWSIFVICDQVAARKIWEELSREQSEKAKLYHKTIQDLADVAYRHDYEATKTIVDQHIKDLDK